MVDYETFMKHAKAVTDSITSELERHQNLKGVKHFEDGSAVVTDAFRLYLAKGVHNRTDGVVISPGGKKLNVDYPNVKRLIPDNNGAKQEFQIHVQALLEAADIIHSVGKMIEGKSIMKFEGNTVSYQSFEIGGFRYQRELSVTFETSFWMDPKFVMDAMKLFKAAKCDDVTFRFFGAMRPVTFECDNLIALILPIRKY